MRELRLEDTPANRPRIDELLAAGHHVRCELVRVERTLDGAAHALRVPPGLTLTSAAAEPSAFIDGFARALAGTRNRFADASRPNLVLARLIRAAGRAFDSRGWFVARVGEAIAGVILPQPRPARPGAGGMSFVGVVPEARGRGLGRALHAVGLGLLARRGVTRYVDHTDVENTPMLQVFQANGCHVAARVLWLLRDLDTECVGRDRR